MDYPIPDISDFSLTDPKVDLGNKDDTVTITIRHDKIALEFNETFRLILEPEGKLQPNEFVFDTLNIVIIDRDSE